MLKKRDLKGQDHKKPAWTDNAVKQEINIEHTSRLRKLKETEEETHIDIQTY
jgi:hypothetical protein